MFRIKNKQLTEQLQAPSPPLDPLQASPPLPPLNPLLNKDELVITDPLLHHLRRLPKGADLEGLLSLQVAQRRHQSRTGCLSDALHRGYTRVLEGLLRASFIRSLLLLHRRLNPLTDLFIYIVTEKVSCSYLIKKKEITRYLGLVR